VAVPPGAPLAAAAIGLLLLRAFLLAVPLVLGRYPGEELLASIARRLCGGTSPWLGH
jgi:hypothetical protein